MGKRKTPVKVSAKDRAIGGLKRYGMYAVAGGLTCAVFYMAGNLDGRSAGTEVQQMSSQCTSVQGTRVCAPLASPSGAAMVKATADGWARYSDGTRWDGDSFR